MRITLPELVGQQPCHTIFPSWKLVRPPVLCPQYSDAIEASWHHASARPGEHEGRWAFHNRLVTLGSYLSHHPACTEVELTPTSMAGSQGKVSG